MTIDVKEFQRLQATLARVQRDADRAAGAYRELTKRLKEQHGCRTMAEAEELLSQMERDTTAAEKRYQKALVRFEHKWSEVLESQE